jgi:nucleoside-diphosphate-sugar epimerase
VKGDGSEKLDFTYIEDLIQGLNNIIESPNSFNQIFNITTGNARSVSDVIDVLKEIVPDIEVEFIDKDSLNPERGTLNISKAESLLQYRPKFSLESGITNYVKWYENLYSTYNINLRKSGERLIND